MENSFNQIDMMILSRLSYYKVPGGRYQSDGNAIEPYRLQDMLTNSNIETTLRVEFGDSAFESLLKKAQNGNYKIVKAVDNTYISGFEALAIEGPDSKTVTVVARGSEGLDLGGSTPITDIPDVIQDWIVADFIGIGVMSESGQQNDMNKFLEDLKRYDIIDFGGHSLGGNLVVSGAVCFDDPDKIRNVYTYNSPGMNQAYIKKHLIGIDKVQDKITNYQNQDDWVSDIHTKIGTTKVVAPNDKNANAHSLNKFAFDGNDFSYNENNEKGLIHGAVNIAVTAVTSMIASTAFDEIAEILSLAVDIIQPLITIIKTFITEYVVPAFEAFGKWICDSFKAAIEGIGNFFSNIANGIKSAFQPNAGMIYLATESVSYQANLILRYKTEYENNINSLKRLIYTLNSIWKGDAQDEFLRKFQSMEPIYTGLSNVLGQYAELLNKAIQNMNMADSNLRSMIQYI